MSEFIEHRDCVWFINWKSIEENEDDLWTWPD